ncbi:MAG: hypothetical protein KatS3mg126_2430 [Lysobacteraceae bacterium]|nr:MAG: hypothetical protein KatS3mg126_2430 [Xanthomonadaceae bacterium]
MSASAPGTDAGARIPPAIFLLGLVSLITDVTPADCRGTAFGAFNLVFGCGLLLASALAGILWDVFGAAATFLAGAALAGTALLGLTRLVDGLEAVRP